MLQHNNGVQRYNNFPISQNYSLCLSESSLFSSVTITPNQLHHKALSVTLAFAVPRNPSKTSGGRNSIP
jgi:hypothetical protein